jgi:hypothetical protein
MSGGAVNSEKTRRGLLILFSAVFAIWVVLMLVMYFTTVYPQRYPATSPISNLTR